MRQRTASGVTWVGVTTMGLLALVPAGALASTVSTRIKRVFYAAAPGEINNLTISLTGADFTLSDPGATITVIPMMPACTANGSMATCPSVGIIGITVSGGDGADSIANTTATRSTLSGGDGSDSLEGGTGDDTLRGNQGVDTHTGGPGNDLIDARGDRGDIVSCGDGLDTVRADVSDSVAPDCEMVDRGVPLPVPPPPGPPPATEGLLGPGETRTLDPGACSQDKLGTARNDRLAGSSFGDNLFGLQGNDVMRGGPGDDCLFGGTGHDRLAGAGGDDRLLGDDSAKGVGGNDRLSGNAGDDLLAGGPGNDRLKGGAGRNRLRGGLGNDRLNAVNGRVDRLVCGRGTDVARADGVDRLVGCERVRRRR